MNSLLKNISKLVKLKKSILSDSLIESEKNFIYVENKLKKLLENYYSSAFYNALNGDILYRAARIYDNNNPLAIEIHPGIRISASTQNIYTKLLSDVFESWKKFPKRNRSTVATMSEKIAKKYTSIYNDSNIKKQIYIVLPTNNEKIGICPSNDIWYSFTKQLERLPSVDSLQDFNLNLIRFLSEILNVSKETLSNLFISGSNNDIIIMFNKVTKIFDDLLNNNSEIEFSNIETDSVIKRKIVNKYGINTYYFFLDYLVNRFEKNNYTYLEYLEKIIFTNTQFKSVAIENLKTISDHEVWFEGSCLHIPLKIWDDLFEK